MSAARVDELVRWLRDAAMLDVGPDDRLVDRGMDSFHIVELFAFIERRFGVASTGFSLRAHPTARAIDAWITSQARGA